MSMLKWRFYSNFSPSLAYRLHGDPLSGETLRVVRELNENGIALTSVGRILGSGSSFDELTEAVESLLRDCAADIVRAKTSTKHAEGWTVF